MYFKIDFIFIDTGKFGINQIFIFIFSHINLKAVKGKGSAHRCKIIEKMIKHIVEVIKSVCFKK
ncbi:hypothetical protein SDC9_196616 [bioreactor metagenome]|uniref:Uncharacterized protein n=1 Tax=bioreactor metagenome TaxID=1076179 RepID=A0A645IP30_9ZZZZ